MPDRFDELFRQGGGRYVPQTSLDTQLLERARREIERQCQDPAIKSNAPNIEIGFVKNISFNACATIDAGIGLIGMFWGSYALLFRLFNLMLARPDILTDIGDAQKEIARDDLFYMPTT